jgi:hypothetical protein
VVVSVVVTGFSWRAIATSSRPNTRLTNP